MKLLEDLANIFDDWEAKDYFIYGLIGVIVLGIIVIMKIFKNG